MRTLIKITFLLATIVTIAVLGLILSGYTHTDDKNIIQQIVSQLRLEEVDRSMDGLEKSFSSGSFEDFMSNSSALIQRKFIITQIDVSRPLLQEANTLIAHARYFQQDKNGLGEEISRYFYFLYDIESGWKLSGETDSHKYWTNFLTNQPLSQVAKPVKQ